MHKQEKIKFFRGASPKQRAKVKILYKQLNGRPISPREMRGMSQKKAGFLISDLQKNILKKSSGKKKKSRTGKRTNGQGGVPTSGRSKRVRSSQDEVSSSQSRSTKIIVRKKNGSTYTVQKVVTP